MANGLIGKVTAGGGTHLVASTAYFTCATGAGSAAKIAKAADTDLNSATLMTGLTVYVKFENSNTAANPTLTLQTNGGSQLIAAKSIKKYGTVAPGTNGAVSWVAGAIMSFTYDGTNWLMTDAFNNYKGAIGNCTTAAATSEKTVSIGNFVLEYGSEVYVTFSNTNTGAANPTLNVNSTGAHEIRYKGVPVFKQGLATGFIYHLIYDGTYWQLLNQPAFSYVTCTSAANAAKAVTCSGFILYPGATIDILFTADNSVKNPTLNINGTGAKPILWMNIGNTKNNRDTVVDNIAYRTLRANHLYRFVYDGTNYRIVDDTFRHTTTSGRTALEAVTYTQEDYDEYVSNNGGAPSWNVGDVKTAAVSEVVGYELLGLGNDIASNKDGGATGRITLYGDNTGFHSFRSAKSSGNKIMYLPDYDGDGYLTHVASATKVGSDSEPVYVAANGRVTSTGKTLAYNVNAETTKATQWGVAYYSTANKITSTAAGTSGQYLKSAGTNAPSWASFVKPTVAWTGGTTAGPTLAVTTDGGTSTAVAIPSANGTTASGIVTTGAQSFGGIKTFSNTTASTTTTTGAVVISGGLGVANRVTSKEVNTTNPMVVSAGKVYSNISGSNVMLPSKTSMLFSNGLAIAHPGLTQAADVGWIRVLGTSESDMVLEIATGDDAGAGEKIVARQYNGANAVAKEAVLLGINGVTSFPVSVTSPSFIGALTGNATSATGFATAKTIALTGDVTGSATGGDGSNGWSIATTIGEGSIANGKLTNSKVTIAGNDVSLGGSLAAATLKTSLGLNSAMHYIGKATVTITDGSTIDPKIGGNATTLVSGDVIIDSSDSREYVWNGSKWELLGGDSSYKVTQDAVTDAAYSGSDTATTFVSAVTQNANGVITVTKRKLPTYNNYSHPTTSGNKHIPSGGSSGQFLGWSADGTAAWVNNPNTDTKNTAGSTNSDSKLYLIGATSQAANPTTYSDSEVYTTNGTLTAKILSTSAGIHANTVNSNAAGGISLYGTNPDIYGLVMRGTGTATGQLGKHGYVQGDWAGYLTFYGATNRGYVFRHAGANVASVNGEGNAVFNGSVTVGGNAANTSGARMVYNSTEKTLDFVFA